MRMILGAFTTMFIFGLLRMKPWAVLLLIGLGMFAMDAQAKRMDFDCEDHKHDDLAALACNIYWESRGQGEQGMLGIVATTLWRVRDPRWPDTIADVVWERNWSRHFQKHVAQFSWTLDGRPDRPFAKDQKEWDVAWKLASNFAISAEQKDWMCPHIQQTWDIWNMLAERGVEIHWHPIKCEAYDEFMESKFYMMEILDPTGGALYYHADYVTPWWAQHYEHTVTIENHLWYKDKPKK